MKPFLIPINPHQTKVITQLKAKIRKLESEIEVLKHDLEGKNESIKWLRQFHEDNP